MKFKTINLVGYPDDPFDDELADLFQAKFGGGARLQVLDTWARASEVEKIRWTRAAARLGVKPSGGTFDLVETIIRGRALDTGHGIYFDPAASPDDLDYAARRLAEAGMEVAHLDWTSIEFEDEAAWHQETRKTVDNLGDLGSLDVLIFEADPGPGGEDAAMAAEVVAAQAATWGASILLVAPGKEQVVRAGQFWVDLGMVLTAGLVIGDMQ